MALTAAEIVTAFSSSGFDAASLSAFLAQAKLQVATASVQFFAAIPGMPMLNLKAFMDDYLDAFGIQDKDRYYSQKQQQPAPAPGPQQPQAGQAGQNGQPPGVSAPQATDANSPSNAFSQSPVAAMQRMGAMSGGPNNT